MSSSYVPLGSDESMRNRIVQINIRRRRPIVCTSFVATTLLGSLFCGLISPSQQHGRGTGTIAVQLKRNQSHDIRMIPTQGSSSSSSNRNAFYSVLQTHSSSFTIVAMNQVNPSQYNVTSGDERLLESKSNTGASSTMTSVSTSSSSSSTTTTHSTQTNPVTETVVAMTDTKTNLDKRMNAVGDPDGNSSDDEDDDDDESSSSSSEEIENDLEEFMKKTATQMKDAAQRLVQGIMLRNNNIKKNDDQQQHIRHQNENHPDPDDATTTDDSKKDIITTTFRETIQQQDHQLDDEENPLHLFLQEPFKEEKDNFNHHHHHDQDEELDDGTTLSMSTCTTNTSSHYMDTNMIKDNENKHDYESSSSSPSSLLSEEAIFHFSHQEEPTIHVDMEILSSVSPSSTTTTTTTTNINTNHEYLHNHSQQVNESDIGKEDDHLLLTQIHEDIKIETATTTGIMEETAIIEQQGLFRGGASASGSSSVQSQQTIVDEFIHVSQVPTSEMKTYPLSSNDDGTTTLESGCVVLDGSGNGGGDGSGNDDHTSSDLKSSLVNSINSTVIKDLDSHVEGVSVEKEFQSRTQDNFDQALIDAFLPILFLPPPATALEYMKKNVSTIDIESRRRLDRRTLYQALLLELTHAGTTGDNSQGRTGSSTKTGDSSLSLSTRRYLDAVTSRNLRGAVSLASQPRWRRHILVSSQMNAPTESVMGSNHNHDNETDVKERSVRVSPWWWQGGIRLYTTEEEDEIEHDTSESSSQQTAAINSPGMMGMWGASPSQEEDEEGSGENLDKGQSNMLDGNLATTMSIQETVAMALAHSLNCGLALIDDEAISSVRQKLLESQVLGLNSESSDIRPNNLLGHLLRLCNEGKISAPLRDLNSRMERCGRISDRMERDIMLGLDDPHDDMALDSLRIMREEENIWYSDSNEFDSSNELIKKPLPLILLLRSDTATNLLKSKSFVERIARECVSADSIHTLMLGRGIDATTTTLPQAGKNQASNLPFSQRRAFVKRDDATATTAPSSTGSSNPFASFSNMPPGMAMPPGDLSHSHHSINASGINDPEGSRRFNIFLARTFDKDGKPGIIGGIAPPSAGNLFPQILAFQARKNLIQSQIDGESPEKQQQFEEILQRWTEIMEQQRVGENGDSSPPQFFNATFGLNTDASNSLMTPPEVIQRAIEQAVSQVMEQFASFHLKDTVSPDTDKGSLPPHLAKAFAQILQNESLRRGIAENLARAAPALVDPRCQGVMLSVYVPPGPDHPNFGLMPSQQTTSSETKKQNDRKYTNNHSKGGIHAPPGMTGWLNKILSSTNSKTETSSVGSDEEASMSVKSQDDGGYEENTSSVSKNEAPKDNNLVAGTWRQNERKAAISAATELLSTIQLKDNLKKTSDSKEYVSKSTQTPEQKAQKHLTRLQALCRSIPLRKPQDPVRSRSWAAWTAREHGCVMFRKNRRELQQSLLRRNLGLRTNIGTKGLGSRIRQMMSLKDISIDMDEVIKCAVELEAARSQRLKEFPWQNEEIHEETVPTSDRSLEQLILGDPSRDSIENDVVSSKASLQLIHPKTIESALSIVCQISPSPGGGSSSMLNARVALHRTKEEIMAMTKDKHERALINQVVSPQDIGVSYDMIGGLSEVKELLRQSITYPLKYPHLYSEGIAREAVKGVLLFGPPGTGKTMLAKAVATEGGATFLSVDASSIENKWLGESEKNAKAVFTLARRLAPCVIFIDEVDSILSSREGSSSDDSAHGTLTSVKTTMMAEWDGLNSGTNGVGEAGNDRVVVIGSTNRPFDLDEAVLRRFPRRILVDLPDLETRREILEVTLAENRVDPNVNLTAIAERLDGYTGSDIKEICREAVVQISHEQARLLDQGYGEDEDVLDVKISGVGDIGQDLDQKLRPVTTSDFDKAMKKLKRSVSEKGRELVRVWEWNDEYGEIKKKDKRRNVPQMMNMFL